MKILQLCLRVPDPPGDGGAIAMKAIAESLILAGAKLKILAFNTRKHFVGPEQSSASFRELTAMETVYLDATVRPWPAFINLFTGSSYNISRFKSSEFTARLISLLEQGSYDVVQIESLFLAPYVSVIRQHSKARIVLREHNIEYLIWQRMLDSTQGFLKKWYLGLLTGRLRKYEISMLNSYDAILPITPQDAEVLRNDGCRLPLCITPLGLNTEKYRSYKKAGAGFSVFHLGSMDWMPNIEAVKWFLDRVFPQITTAVDPVKVYIAGKKMPLQFKSMADENLVVEDVISDALKYMSDKTVMVVPLLSGSGLRVKIIEGMAMGKTIISTTIGAEGIACRHLENILIADTAEEFVMWILKCREDPAFCSEIGRKAALLAESRYDNKVIGLNLYQFYSAELLGSFTLAS